MFNFTSKKEEEKLSEIDTCEKASKAYFSFKSKKLKVLALKKWNDICLPLIKLAIENKNPTPLLHEKIPLEGEAKKMLEEHLDELFSSTPTNQIILFYEHLWYPSLRSLLVKLTSCEIEKANSVDELLKIKVTYYYPISVVEARIKKMIFLCKDHQELQNLEGYIYTHCKEVACPVSSSLIRLLDQKNEEIILDGLITTTDIKTLYEYQKTVWRGSRIDNMISERIKYLLTRS